MKETTITITIREDGTAVMRQDDNEAAVFQNCNNALGQVRINADKFFAETKVEKSIIAKKELDENAQRDSELPETGEGDAPDTV